MSGVVIIQISKGALLCTPWLWDTLVMTGGRFVVNHLLDHALLNQ